MRNRPLLIPILFALITCAVGACGDSESGSNLVQADVGETTSIQDISGDSNFQSGDVDDVEGLIPPLGCNPPSELLADPLTLVAKLEPQLTGKGQKHMLDIEVDSEAGLIFAGGMPGLSSWKMEGNKLSFLSAITEKHEHIALLGDGYVAMSNRGKSSKNTSTMKEGKVTIVDATNPSQLTVAGSIQLKDAAGMSSVDERLYVVSHDGHLHVLDVSQKSNPTITSSVSGLGNPWEIAIQSSNAYVADNSEGVAVVSLSQPDAPTLGAKVKTAGGAQDVAISGTHLYVAVGSYGIQAFSLEDPKNPLARSIMATDGGVISVSADNSLVWGTTQESVVVFDVSDVAAPVPLGVEDTNSWAMHVFAKDNRAYVADWRSVNVYEIDTNTTAPDADPSLSELYFFGGDTKAMFLLTNRGGAELVVSGMDTGDDRLTVTADSLSLSPGDSTIVTLSFADDGQPLDTELCIATNDPDETIQKVNVSTFSSGSSVMIGQAAPDFALQDVTTGAYHTLSEQIGRPVVLLFFATW